MTIVPNPTEATQVAEQVQKLYELMSQTDKTLIRKAVLRAQRKTLRAEMNALTAKHP